MNAAAAAPGLKIESLRRRLVFQALLQSALFFIPPLLAAWYIVFFLYRFAWLGPDAMMAAAAIFLLAASALAAARFWPRQPSEKTAARLLDLKAGGADRFVTLATIEPSLERPELLSRLQAEAAALQGRVEFKRDFPFRVERPILHAFIGALVALLVFHLFFELLPFIKTKPPGAALAPLAERLSHVPGRAQLAARLKNLAAALDDPALSDDEKRALIRQAQSEIDRKLAGAGQSDQDSEGGRDLLSRAKEQLSGLREGLEQGQGQGKGPGGQAGTGKQTGSGSGAGEGAAAGQQKGSEGPAPSAGDREPTRSESTGPGGRALRSGKPEDGKSIGEDAGNDPGRKPQYSNRLQSEGGAGGASKDGVEGPGSKSDGPTPQNFLRPGEAGDGLKDARFVVVEIPEPEGGPATGSGEGKRKSAGAGSPVGNLPLTEPERPEAAAEKQMLPLEYRGLLR